MKRIFAILISLILLFIFPSNIKAEGEFATTYDVIYDVDELGETIVTEKISLKNLTDKYYASSFSLTIGATQISDVAAFDSGGPLEVTTENLGNKTEISVKLNQQVAGKDKQSSWTLKFKSKDFAQKQGKIWQVSIPKVVENKDLNSYNLTLNVPSIFGVPTTILPDPRSSLHQTNRLQFKFDKEQLLNSGILANFGQNQFLDFNLEYQLINDQAIPTILILALPPDTSFQQVLIDRVDPKPENVKVDEDGNFLASFKLNKASKLKVNVEGSAKLFINPRYKDEPLTKNYFKELTSQKPFWEKENPLVKAKIFDIFGNDIPDTNQKKARLINDFVVSNLEYNQRRLEDDNFQRLGTLTVLNNPDNALCLEFSDLFITLARASNIPSRQLIGYGYSSNNNLRPLSLKKDILHAWSEYYDPNIGWVMVDPTWENTTGGVDYFSKFDLNHFVIAKVGVSSTHPNLPSRVDIKFSDIFSPISKTDIKINVASEIYGGLPNKGSIVINNLGNSTIDHASFSIASSKINLTPSSKNELGNLIFTPLIPPFGKLDYLFELKTNSLLSAYEDTINIKFASSSAKKKILVNPFFAIRNGMIFLGVGMGTVGILYILSILVHLKSTKIASPRFNRGSK